MGRVLLIGIDGGECTVIDKLLEKGELPNMKQLIERGVKSPLESTIHPSSEQAWPSLYTGTNNGKHGIFGYLKRKKEGYAFQIVSKNNLREKSIFEVLSRQGLRVITLGMPLTYPVEEVNGYMVSGLFCPGKHIQWTYPMDFKDKVESISPDYIIDLTHCNIKNDNDLVEKNKKAIRDLGNLALALLREKWDLFTVVFTSTDRIQHKFWRHQYISDNPYQEVINDSYKEIDRYIGKFLENVPQDTTIFIVSDHGFCDLRGGIVINNVLKEHGYFVARKAGIPSRAAKFFVKIAFRVYKRVFGIRYKAIAKRYFPKIGSKLVSSLTYQNVDWSQTKAFAVSSGNICINKKGREPKGCVSDSEYEKVRDGVIRKLKAVKDDGTNVFQGVYKREEIYRGSAVQDAPDIIVHFHDGYRGIMFGFNEDRSIVKEDDVFISDNSGAHAYDGVFIASGYAINGSLGEKPRIIDIAPTILQLLGIEPTGNMDGRIIREILKKDTKKKPKKAIGEREKSMIDRAIDELDL